MRVKLHEIACLVVSVRRPSLESMLEDYWRLMPEYQNVDLSDLQPLRILFGFFPTYRQVQSLHPWVLTG